MAGVGYASRFAWAQAILEFDSYPEEQTVQKLEPARTTDFPTPAQRPTFSALNGDLFVDTFSIKLPGWKESLRLALSN